MCIILKYQQDKPYLASCLKKLGKEMIALSVIAVLLAILLLMQRKSRGVAVLPWMSHLPNSMDDMFDFLILKTLFSVFVLCIEGISLVKKFSGKKNYTFILSVSLASLPFLCDITYAIVKYGFDPVFLFQPIIYPGFLLAEFLLAYDFVFRRKLGKLEKESE